MRAIEQMEQQNAAAKIKGVKIKTRKILAHKKSGINIVEKEDNKYILTIGKHIISEKEFKAEADAIKYINTKPWELIRAYTIIMAMNVFEAKMKKDVEKLAKIMNEMNEATQNQKKE